MKVVLMKKDMAIAYPVKQVIIEGSFDDYYSEKDGVNESLLIKNLPDEFLYKKSNKTSVWIESEHRLGSKGLDSSEGIFADAETFDSSRLLLFRD